MGFRIAIASGKGGTGKTTVSVNLWFYLSKIFNNNVLLVDCDVEEPNDHLFFPDAPLCYYEPVNQLIPEIDSNRCTFCQKCDEYCEFNAISIIPSVKCSSVNPSLCHSCGACLVACTYGAINELPYCIGSVQKYLLPGNSRLITGKLKIGSPQQTMLIRETKIRAVEPAEIILYDAPPGTSCPVVATLADADYVILVTEPTPFGLHDLKLMVELLSGLGKPFGVIINKAGLGNPETNRFLSEKDIPLFGEIPFSKEYASLYATGNLFKNVPVEIEKGYLEVVRNIELFIKQ